MDRSSSPPPSRALELVNWRPGPPARLGRGHPHRSRGYRGHEVRQPSRREALGWDSGTIQEPPETACPGREQRWLGRQAGSGSAQSHRDTLTSFATSQIQEGLGGGRCCNSKRGVPSGHPEDFLGVGEWRPWGPSTCFVPASQRLLCGQLPRPHPHQAFPWTELWQRRQPPLPAHRETPTRPPEKVLAGGWVAWVERIWLGPKQAGEVVSAQPFSPQVRRILIPWTERQTDRQTPHPRQPCFLGSPRALCLHHFGGAVRSCGRRLQVLGKGRPGPCPHIHTEAYIYRDTPIQIQVHTKHAHMPINTHTHTHTCTVPQAGSASWHRGENICGGLGRAAPHPSFTCRLSPPSPPSSGSEWGREQVRLRALNLRVGS